jgi:hypothetical protein
MRIGTVLFVLFLLTVEAHAAEGTVTFKLPSGVIVQIDERSFDRSKASVLGCTEAEPGCVIDGHVAIGTAGLLPRTYLRSISVTVDGASYYLDVSGMFNAWGGRPLEVKGVVRYFGGRCWNDRNCRFRGLFSDAGGAFVAEWAIVDGVALRTVLSDSSDLVDLFRRNIDPPIAD